MLPSFEEVAYMALKLGLLGSNISRSRMPRLQKHLGKLQGIDIDYVLLDDPRFSALSPRDQIQKARAEGFHGLNVTHPYKQQIYPLVDSVHLTGHELIGSYNTLLLEKDGIAGANTDYSGFKKAYQRIRGSETPGQVLLCGAGGVGRAVATGLADHGCKSILVYDITGAQAQSLVSLLEQQGVSASVVRQDELPDAIKTSDGLVNCTAVGMHSSTASAIDISCIKSQQWAFDAIYTPLNTAFLSQCRQAGMQCISGFDLWISQGLDAFRIFTGKEAEASDALFEETLRWLD